MKTTERSDTLRTDESGASEQEPEKITDLPAGAYRIRIREVFKKKERQLADGDIILIVAKQRKKR